MMYKTIYYNYTYNYSLNNFEKIASHPFHIKLNVYNINYHIH